jgi:hypothetical protein
MIELSIVEHTIAYGTRLRGSLVSSTERRVSCQAVEYLHKDLLI